MALSTTQSPHHPGQKDPFWILFRSSCQTFSFLFMVYFQKQENVRSRLCGFFPWFPTPAAAKMAPELHQIALREK